MLPPSDTVIPPSSSVTRTINITSPARVALRRRLRVIYSQNGRQVAEQAEANAFPPAA